MLDVDDFGTLLLSQRVGTKWRDVIKANDKLQKKLFLKPATLEEAKLLGTVNRENSTDPLTGHRFEDITVQNTLATHWRRGDRLKLTHNVLADMAQPKKGISSWERMYITQPPCSASLDVYVHKGARLYPEDPPEDEGYTEEEDHCFRYYEELGLKPLRHIVDVIEREAIRGGFHVDWWHSNFALEGWSPSEDSNIITQRLPDSVYDDYFEWIRWRDRRGYAGQFSVSIN